MRSPPFPPGWVIPPSIWTFTSPDPTTAAATGRVRTEEAPRSAKAETAEDTAWDEESVANDMSPAATIDADAAWATDAVASDTSPCPRMEQARSAWTTETFSGATQSGIPELNGPRPGIASVQTLPGVPMR